MGAGGVERPSTKGVLVGPGERMDLMARLVEAAGRRPDGTGTAVRMLVDLADLLVEGPGPGRLLLDAEHLPLEDIGLLRRILQRGGPNLEAWVLGRDAAGQGTKAALALSGTRWLAWPPDVDQIVALAEGGRPLVQQLQPAPTPFRPAEASLSPLPPPPASPAPATPTPQAQESRPRGATGYDLAPLLQELLGALSLKGRRAPRFHFLGNGAFPVRLDRATVTTVLEAMLLLARSCAGPGEAVHVTMSERASGEADVHLEFPAGPLASLPANAVLSHELWEQVRARLPELESTHLPEALKPLRVRGGEVLAESAPAGHMSLRLRLPLSDAGASVDAVFA